MPEIPRSYYLPTKLIKAIDKDARKSGLVRGTMVAASVLSFLDSEPAERAEMFDRLDRFLTRRKG